MRAYVRGMSVWSSDVCPPDRFAGLDPRLHTGVIGVENVGEAAGTACAVAGAAGDVMVDLSHGIVSQRCWRCHRPVTARLQGIDLQDYPEYLQAMDWDKLQYFLFVARSEERRVGQGCVSTFRSRLSPDH